MIIASGFYWYRGSGKERFDPDEGWVVVRIDADGEFAEAYFTGTEIAAYPVTELMGEFVGPIHEPEPMSKIE